MIRKKIYFVGETRIMEVRLFGLLIYKTEHERYFTVLAGLRGR